MRKILIVVGIVLSLALITSCSPDQLMNAGSTLGKLGDATLASRKSAAVTEATENVKAYVTTSESSFSLGAATTYDPKLTIGSEANYLATINQTAKLLLQAKNSSANDDSLREALNERYTGVTSSVGCYKNVYDGMIKDSVIGLLLNSLNENPGAGQLLATMIGIPTENGNLIDTVISKLHEINIPFPLQSYDYFLLLSKLMGEVSSIMEIINSKPSGGSDKVDLSALKQFQSDLTASVGSRNYQTVGDKIASGLIYAATNVVLEANTAYKNSSLYTGLEAGHKYDLFGDFLLKDGSSYIDTILSYLDAVAYIYDVKIDLAGLVAGLI